MDLNSLSRKEKIDLIKRIQSGEVNVINGEIVENSAILIKRNDKWLLNGVEVDYEEVASKVEFVLWIPDNGREDS